MVKSIASGVVGAGVFALVLLGWQSYAEAPPSYVQMADQVVRITQGIASGSGFFIAPDKVITAAHVADSTPQGVVETRDRRVFAISSTVRSEKFDIAVIQLANPVPGASIAQITCEAPQEDTPITAIGHPFRTVWNVFRFLVAGKVEDTTKPAGTLIIQGSPNPGLSGAPAFNSAGVAVGIITNRILEGGGVPTGMGALLPFSAVCELEGDPVKEALGW